MNPRISTLAILFLLTCGQVLAQSLRFAILSDLHVSFDKPSTFQNVESIIDEINLDKSISCVFLAGDLTQNADSNSYMLLSKTLQRIQAPYFCSPGNHDATWTSANLKLFVHYFGGTRFIHHVQDYTIISIPSIPKIRFDKGHFDKNDIKWLKKSVKTSSKIIFITHYPFVEKDLDNGDELIKILSKKNTLAIFSGHYHRNTCLNTHDIPSFTVNSVEALKNKPSSYCIVELNNDSLFVFDKKPKMNMQMWFNARLTQK